MPQHNGIQDGDGQDIHQPFGQEVVQTDNSSNQKMKQEFYLPWHYNMEHVTDFIRRLDKYQAYLAKNGITISDEDKTQHFVEQMYASGMFDVQQMRLWENQPEYDKTWKDAKGYFKEIVIAIETYQVNSGSTVGQTKYESAANMEEEEWAKQGDELRAYLKAMTAQGEAGNEELQQMAKTMANPMMTGTQTLLGLSV